MSAVARGGQQGQGQVGSGLHQAAGPATLLLVRRATVAALAALLGAVQHAARASGASSVGAILQYRGGIVGNALSAAAQRGGPQVRPWVGPEGGPGLHPPTSVRALDMQPQACGIATMGRPGRSRPSGSASAAGLTVASQGGRSAELGRGGPGKWPGRGAPAGEPTGRQGRPWGLGRGAPAGASPLGPWRPGRGAPAGEAPLQPLWLPLRAPGPARSSQGRAGQGPPESRNARPGAGGQVAAAGGSSRCTLTAHLRRGPGRARSCRAGVTGGRERVSEHKELFTASWHVCALEARVPVRALTTGPGEQQMPRTWPL